MKTGHHGITSHPCRPGSTPSCKRICARVHLDHSPFARPSIGDKPFSSRSSPQPATAPAPDWLQRGRSYAYEVASGSVPGDRSNPRTHRRSTARMSAGAPAPRFLEAASSPERNQVVPASSTTSELDAPSGKPSSPRRHRGGIDVPGCVQLWCKPEGLLRGQPASTARPSVMKLPVNHRPIKTFQGNRVPVHLPHRNHHHITTSKPACCCLQHTILVEGNTAKQLAIHAPCARRAAGKDAPAHATAPGRKEHANIQIHGAARERTSRTRPVLPMTA